MSLACIYWLGAKLPDLMCDCMEKKWKVMIVLLLVCGGMSDAIELRAQHRSVRFQHLTIEDGLAQNMVDCILQDSHGFMWIGTWNGLCRYDGYTLEVFSKESSRPNSLGNNFIYALYEDQFGNLWIGTAEGLYTYIYDRSVFVPVHKYDTGTNAALGGVIPVIETASASSMWVGTAGGIVEIRVVSADGDFEVVDNYAFGSDENKLRGSSIHTILKDSQGNVLVGTDEGINQISSGEITYMTNDTEDANSISSNQVLKIFESASGDIWIGTEFGLNRYNPVTGAMLRIFNDPADPESLLHNTVMDIIEDRAGNLFLATLGGLSVLKKGQSGFTNHNNQSRSKYSLNNDFLNCLLMDEWDNIWIGTERGGLNFYNVKQNTFEHFEPEIGNENSLNHSTINSIYEDAENIWIGTAGGGLNRYIKRSRTYVHYTHDPADASSISSNFVTSIFLDSRKRLWIGTWGSGLNILKQEGGAAATFTRSHVTNTNLVNNFVSSIAEDAFGNIWVGTIGGLSRLQPGSNRFETLFAGPDEPRITGVGNLILDSQTNLWACTRTGLYHIRMNRAAGREFEVAEYRHDPSDPHSISGNYVISVLEDSQGAMWFGTYGQGLNKLRLEGNTVRFEALTTADGISNNIIYGIQEDNKGDLWLSTDFGLSRVSRANGHIRNFYISDGLLNNQYYWSAAYKNDLGKLYFGGMNGMDTFFPDWINDEVTYSEVVLTNIKLLNESVVPGEEYNGVEVLERNIHETENIRLSYKEKMFAIEFSSFNYHEPAMIRYAYVLEGFDDNWNYVGADRRYASYTNLKPGNYTFKVKVSDSNGEFSSPPATVQIEIAPPFWETVWFRLILVVFLIGLVFGYIRFRTYNLKRQKRTLEKQVRERTQKINQQKEALSFQAVQLQSNNQELEEQKKLIEGQNLKLETQNKEILNQRDELIKLNHRLKLVSQLRLSFFTNISHEFRTPLTLIIGPLEKLLKDQKFDNEVRNTLNIINRNAQRLLHLINQIMDFRKIEKGRMELKVTRGNISEFCENVFTAFQPLSEIKETVFDFKVDSLPDEVWFDTQKMENILYNLLSNAFKYTPGKGGKIRFEVSGLTYGESRLRADDTEMDGDKNVISIKVSDSGIGISEENIPLVFKRFYRINSAEAFNIGGSGIGLALARELIRAHHGDIFVSSKLGYGSTFEIQFPCLRGSYGVDELTDNHPTGLTINKQVEMLKNEFMDYVDELDEDNAELPRVKGRRTVLVVEDNLDLRKFIALRLNSTYNILEAGDGVTGVEMAERFNPDLIISDVMMPRMDGLELCATVKNNLSTSHIPVILLTAKSSVEDQIEGLEIGADDYLPKPFNFELLEARVQNLMDNRDKLRQQLLKSMDVGSAIVASNAKDQKFLELAIGTVEKHMEDSAFGVKEFVKHMGISRSLLHKKLTALTSQSAAEFINHLRMKEAMKLLRQNEMNISEVAYAVGYNDPKYFSRLFSRQFGCSPKEFLSATPVVAG